MIEIRYQNQKLHIPVGTKIRVKKVNPFFAKSVVPAVFSYPFELPSDPVNDKLLDFVKEPTAVKTQKKKLDVVIRLGTTDFSGQLIIHKWQKSYQVNLMIDGTFVNQQAQKLLKDFDWPEEEIYEFKDYWYGYIGDSGNRTGKVKLEISDGTTSAFYQADYLHSFEYTVQVLANEINADQAFNDCIAYVDGRHILVVFQHTNPSANRYFYESTTGTLIWKDAYYHLSANKHGTGIVNETDLQFHINRVADQVCLPRIFTYYMVENPGLYPDGYNTEYYQNECKFYHTRITDSSLPDSLRRFGFFVDLYGTTPFLYVKKVLLAICEKIGYSLDDDLFDDELETLTFYNDKLRGLTRYDSVGGDDFVILPTGDNIDIKRHMPNATLADVLKSINQMFCCGIFINEIEQKITLKPLKKMLQSNNRVNWSNRIRPIKFEFVGQGYSLFYATPDDESASTYFNWDDEITVTTSVDLYTDLPTTGLTEGDVYYVAENNNLYKAIRENGASTYRWQLLTAKIFSIYNEAEEQNALLQIEALGAPLPFTMTEHPADSIPVPYAKTSSPNYIIEDKQATVGLRYLFYRGRVPTNAQVNTDDGYMDFETYLGSPLAYDPQGNDIGEYELVWHGDKGLYNVWWKPFLDRFADSRLFEFQTFLSLEEIVAYDFTELVHANGKDYLIKEIDYEIEVGKNSPLQTCEAYEV